MVSGVENQEVEAFGRMGQEKREKTVCGMQLPLKPQSLPLLVTHCLSNLSYATGHSLGSNEDNKGSGDLSTEPAGG